MPLLAEAPYGGGAADGDVEEAPLPYPDDSNAIINAVGRVTAVSNPPHIVGTQSRHFSLRTSCYDPEAERRSREFTLECICPNSKRWEVARNIIPPVGALVHVSAQLIGTFENGKVVLPAVEVLELLRLPSNATTTAGPAGLTSPRGVASGSSPTVTRVMKNLNTRAGKKVKGNPDTTPLAVPFPLAPPASTGSQSQRARPTLPSANQVGLDAQLQPVARDLAGGDAAVPMLISDDSSSASTVANDSVNGGFLGGLDDARKDADGDSDASFVSVSRMGR